VGLYINIKLNGDTMGKQLIGIIVFTILGAVVGICKPLSPTLSTTGHLSIMGLLISIGLWIFATRWVPLSIGGVLMMTIFLASGLKYSVVFSGFTNGAIWILVPALYFGFVLTKTGLGKRLALWILSLFRPSYLTLTISWLIIGIILSALTPSITVRIAIMIPIAANTVEICKIQSGTKSAGFIMLVAWAMAVIPGTGWLTGSLWGPIAKGFFASIPSLDGIITFESWGKAMLLPAECIAVFFVSGLFIVMKPEKPLDVPTDTFRVAYRELGPITFREKATLAILIVFFLLFATSRLHHVPDVAICLGAFFLLAIFRIIDLKDISTGISWDFILFLGAVLGLGTVFVETGVSSFLSQAFIPLMDHLSVSPWLFIYMTVALLFVWRFLDIAQLLPTIPIILSFFPIIATNLGIHPLVIFSLCIMAGNCFFMSYQQPFVIIGETLSSRVKWSQGQLFKAGMIYFIACILTLAIVIPYWMTVDLIG
jgi:anion transporter